MVFVGSAFAHISLGFTYLNIGYSGLVYFGILLGGYLFLSVMKFTKLEKNLI
jgi:hypothetical protein